MSYVPQLECPCCGSIVPATSLRADGTRECPRCRKGIERGGQA